MAASSATETNRATHGRNTARRLVVGALACLVALLTAYALMLPAITASGRTYCGLAEHAHDAGCYSQTLTCGLPEGPVTSEVTVDPHKHGDSCYVIEQTLVCALDEQVALTGESGDPADEKVLSEGSAVPADEAGSVQPGGSEPHSHGESCYQETAILVCELEETDGYQVVVESETHNHDASCYEEALTCGVEEHLHSAGCYSDPLADVETSEEWEASLPLEELTGDWAQDALAIAESQLGYEESSENFAVFENGSTKGYTRYGDWYGDDYGDWCAMFVSFCLRYAGVPVDKMPIDSNCQNWIEELSDEEFLLYRDEPEYEPKAGDIVFFEWGGDGVSDHVGFVYEIVPAEDDEPAQLKTLEGNSGNCVRYRTYDFGDPRIMGYAEVPENDELEAGDLGTLIGEPVSIEELLDISSGPAVFIFAYEPFGQDEPVLEGESESQEGQPLDGESPVPGEPADGGVMMLSVPDAGDEDVALLSDPEPVRLQDYVDANEGTLKLTIFDRDNNEVSKDAEGDYVLEDGKAYKLALDVSLPKGVAPGVYQYQLPEGFDIVGGEGAFELEGSSVGTWTVDGSGLLTMTFGDVISDYSIVSISVAVGALRSTATEPEAPSDEDATVASIAKEGAYRNGRYTWTINATIPGAVEGQQATSSWSVVDALQVVNASNEVVNHVANGLDAATVTVAFGGQTYSVPKLADAGETDLFAWAVSNTGIGADGTVYVQQVDLFSQCSCAAETCQHWADGACGSVEPGTSFCRCWAVEGDTVFTITYETDGTDVVLEHGGDGCVLRNEASLQHQASVEGARSATPAASCSALMPIPGMFDKELAKAFDGTTADYVITLNEAKLNLAEGDEPLVIRDVMTETLVYANGSLVITTEDADLNKTTLKLGEDFTVSYDGSGEAKDGSGNPTHVLEIVILDPKPVKYVLGYSTTLIVPDGATEAVEYGNAASATLLGKTFDAEGEKGRFEDSSGLSAGFKIEVCKTDANTGAVLPGAAFGLFNQEGGLIAKAVTNESGMLVFEDDVEKGIVLAEHVPYYLQEITAPDGYILNRDQHWFCFCGEVDGEGNALDACTFDSGIEGIKVVLEAEVGTDAGRFDIENIPGAYELPKTGGEGIVLLGVAGALLVVVATVMLVSFRRPNGCKK